jgi:hypothetical protein
LRDVPLGLSKVLVMHASRVAHQGLGVMGQLLHRGLGRDNCPTTTDWAAPQESFSQGAGGHDVGGRASIPQMGLGRGSGSGVAFKPSGVLLFSWPRDFAH